jgi:acyl carrier protein
MSNVEIYKSIFVESLQVSSENFNENLEYNEIPEWDSIGHMSLISNIEEKFNITFETDDIIDFSSFKKGKEILTNKYKISF